MNPKISPKKRSRENDEEYPPQKKRKKPEKIEPKTTVLSNQTAIKLKKIIQSLYFTAHIMKTGTFFLDKIKEQLAVSTKFLIFDSDLQILHDLGIIEIFMKLEDSKKFLRFQTHTNLSFQLSIIDQNCGKRIVRKDVTVIMPKIVVNTNFNISSKIVEYMMKLESIFLSNRKLSNRSILDLSKKCFPLSGNSFFRVIKNILDTVKFCNAYTGIFMNENFEITKISNILLVNDNEFSVNNSLNFGNIPVRVLLENNVEKIIKLGAISVHFDQNQIHMDYKNIQQIESSKFVKF